MSRITKRDFITSVAKRSNLRKDVVEDVLKAVVDISIEEIVNNGEFVMKDLFSISSKEWKAYSLAGIQVPAQKRLKIRLSEKVKSFWKLKNEVYPDLGDLTRQELEDALRHHNSQREAPKIVRPVTQVPRASPISGGLPGKLPVRPRQSAPVNVDADNFNPLLDEDD
jgi:nucleoid DNA-binding protein